MAKTTTTKTKTSIFRPATTGPAVTRGHVKEIVDDLLREAFRSQARELEQHLKSIHERLAALETRK